MQELWEEDIEVYFRESDWVNEILLMKIQGCAPRIIAKILNLPSSKIYRALIVAQRRVQKTLAK